MNTLVLLTFAAGVLLGIGRGIDLAFFTDLSTGLCTAGSVWWRYLALALAAVLGIAAGRLVPSRPQALCTRRPLAGWLALAASLCFAWTVGVRLCLFLLGGQSGIGTVVRTVLEVFSVLWFAMLSAAWHTKKEWRHPAGSLYLAVLGSAVFYWCVLARFMENSSSWQRPAQTAMVWQYLAALVFLAALARALYIPGANNGRALASSGLCAFVLCLCWQAPQTVLELLNGANSASAEAAVAYFQGVTDRAQTAFGLALCFVGALGGVCAAITLRKKP